MSGVGLGGVTNQVAVRRRAPSLPRALRVRDRTSSFICRSQAASKGQRHYFVGRGDLNSQHQQAALISRPREPDPTFRPGEIPVAVTLLCCRSKDNIA